jgi:hypothetical protein
MNQKVNKLIKTPLFASIFVPVSVAVYFIVLTSSNVRYWADDFCTATILNQYGFWGAQKYWWLSWTGRYTYHFLIHFFESLGFWTVKIIPVITFLFLVVGGVLLISRIFEKESWLIRLLLYSFPLVLVLKNSPNIVQSFYWQGGVVNYVTPFIFFNLYLWLVIRNVRGKSLLSRDYIFAVILVFLAGGLSETFSFFQILATGAVFLWMKVFVPKNKAWKIALVGFVASLLAVIVVLSAPGNEARMSTVLGASGVIFVIKSSLLGTRWFFERYIQIESFLLSALSAALVFFVVGLEYKKTVNKRLIKLVFLSVFIVLAIFAMQMPSFYAQSITPPERAVFVGMYALFFTLAFIGFILGNLGKSYFKKYSNTIVYSAGLLSIILIVFLTRIIVADWGSVLRKLKSHSQAWDEREMQILTQRQKGKTVVRVKYVEPAGGLDGFVENNGWVASCASGYYGVEKIEVKQ